MEQDIILLFAKPYEMDTDDRGRVCGVSVRYLLTSSLEPREDSVSYGVAVAKGSLDYSQLSSIKCAPAVYRGKFEMQANGQGKVELKLAGPTYIRDLTGSTPEKKQA